MNFRQNPTVLATLLLVFLVQCRGYSYRLLQGWNRYEVDCCYVEAEEGISLDQVTSELQWKWPEIQIIHDRFFPDVDSKPVLVLYKNQESYRAQLGDLPQNLLAHYELQRRAIHVPLDAPASVWRHEMAHRYLHELSPSAPFWFQEGLARFIQGYSTLAGPCDRQSMEGELQQWVLQRKTDVAIKTMELPGNVDFKDMPEALKKSALSGVFVYFLWTRGDLQRILRYLPSNPKADPLYPITGGERGRMEELRQRYLDFLENPVFQAAPAKCGADAAS